MSDGHPLLTLDDVRRAQRRIAPHLHRTPLLRSATLDLWLGHRFVFKAECLQKVGAFKSRGALNTLLALAETGRRPERVVAYSSGNHAQAVAWACARLGLDATVMMPAGASDLKRRATEGYGARVIVTRTRAETEEQAHRLRDEGAFLLPPFDHDDVIAGQGTACLEAIEDGAEADAVFAPCGGGGLLSGTWAAAHGLLPGAAVLGVEPGSANDAARSYRDGRIHRFEDSPPTMADGVQTLALSERTFAHVRRTDGVLEVDEEEIAYWTQWLTHLLKVTIEPTAALGMAGAARWIAGRDGPLDVLVILSGGNLSASTRARVWATDHLGRLPLPG